MNLVENLGTETRA